MPEKVVPKYRKIAGELKRAIQNQSVVAGASLPSHATLMSKYNASLSTVRQAIHQLASEGWVRTEHGRGVFVEKLHGDQPGDRGLISTTVGFAVFGEFEDDDPVRQLYLQGAAAELREHDRDVAYGVFRPGKRQQEQFARFLERVSAVMICQDIPPETLRMLIDSDVRTVVVGHMPSEELSCDEIHNVYADMDGAGYLAAQTLAIHGHRKVAFVSRLPLEHPSTQAVYRGMQLACEQYSFSDGGGFYPRDYPSYVELARQFSEESDLTGLVVMGDHGGIMMLQALAAAGVSVPRQKSVVCLGGLPREMLVGWETPLTRVNVNYRLMGQEAARLLVSDTKAVIHKSVPATLEKGQTIKTLVATDA